MVSPLQPPWETGPSRSFAASLLGNYWKCSANSLCGALPRGQRTSYELLPHHPWMGDGTRRNGEREIKPVLTLKNRRWRAGRDRRSREAIPSLSAFPNNTTCWYKHHNVILGITSSFSSEHFLFQRSSLTQFLNGESNIGRRKRMQLASLFLLAVNSSPKCCKTTAFLPASLGGREGGLLWKLSFFLSVMLSGAPFP